MHHCVLVLLSLPPRTHLSETEDAFVDGTNCSVHHAAKTMNVHFKHWGKGEPQGHQTSQLGGPRRHRAGPLVGVVVEVITAVQVGAIVGVALCLLFSAYET